MLSKLLATFRSAIVCTLSLLATAAMAQTTINVGPNQTYTTIQAGINAAANGDTVLVAPGTYLEHVSFKGKIITLASSAGAAATTIDGGNVNGLATVLFTGGENNSTVLSGFTIRGGGDDIFSGTSFGGVYVSGTLSLVAGPSPTIQNNIITANYCHGIGVQDGTPLILNNNVSGTLQNTTGVGTQESYCGPTDAIFLGGTPNFPNGYPILMGNTIENNSAGGSAIHVNSAQNVLVMNNVIRNNYSRSTGSAYASENTGSNVVVQNLIYGNTSTCGGALSFNGGILIANNTIVDNLYVSLFSGSECTPIAQIFPDNYSYGESYPNRVILNNIISGSTSYPAVNCDQIPFGPPTEATQPTFQNNILYNAGGPFFGSYCIDVSKKYNNIVADAQFVNAAAGDYHLKVSSPAIDTGQNSVVQTFLAMTGRPFYTDFDSKPRVTDETSKGFPVIDMGAYEYPGLLDGNAVTETLTSTLNPSYFANNVTFNVVLTASSGIPTGTVQFKDGSTILGVATVSATGTASYPTSMLAIGTHTITAVYQPSGALATATANLTQVVNGYATSTTLTCTPAAIPFGSSAFLMAVVSSTNGTPTGSVSLTDNGAALSTLSLANGSATLAYTGAAVGTHTLVATYAPTGSFAASSGSCSELVTALPSKSILTVTPTTTTFGAPVALTANVSAAMPPGPSIPNGIVTFYNGTTVLGTATLAQGVATLILNNLPGPADTLTCTYNGSSIYTSSTCNAVGVVINAAVSTLSLGSSSNPTPALSPISFTVRLAANGQAAGAGNAVLLSLNGQTIALTTDASGSATYTLSTLTPGSYPVTANFTGNTSLLASAASLTQVVSAIPTTATLAATPNPGYVGQTVTIVATVSAQSTSAQTVGGSISFYDGATLLATQPLATNGAATFTTSNLVLGTHPLTAVFAPASSVLVGSISPVVNEVILASGFTIALSPASLTLAPGASGSTSILLASVGNFAGPLALTYGALPTAATASISPSTVTLSAGGTGTATLTLNTLLRVANDFPARPGSRAFPVVFAAFTLLLVPLSLARRSKLKLLLLLILSAVVLQAAAGCTNAYYITSFVAAGTYQVPVTATDINHNTQTATLTVTVTP